MTQLPLFENNPLNELDSRVRITEIGGELHASVLDILQYHGNKANPTQSWRVIQKALKEQGFESSTQIVEHKFDGRGQRLTPVINAFQFLRIVQTADVPEWEDIRLWLAKLGYIKLQDRASQTRENQIALLQENNLANSYEGRRYVARHANIETLKELNKIIARVCDNPSYGALTNKRYEILFGETVAQIKAMLNSQKIRDSLHLTQIRTLTFAEETLKDVLSSKGELTNEDIALITQVTLPPIADMLRDLMNAQGLHHITGKPLLNSGQER